MELTEHFGSSENSGRLLATASLTHPDKIEDRFVYESGKIWLGRNLIHHTPVGYLDDRHICLVSGTRGGKGTTSIMPNIIEWPGSLLMIDPKGENASVTAVRRGEGSEKVQGLGQKVFVLDPFKQAVVDDNFRARFNPLDAIDPSSPEAIDEAGRLADAIVVTGESKDPHWEESARTVIKVLILHVLTLPLYKNTRTLSFVRQLILEGEKEMVEVKRKKGRKNIPSAQVLLWDMVSRNKAMDGIIAQSGAHFHDLSIHSPKEYNSIRSVAARNTEFLDSPGMKDVLSASDFALSDLKTDPKGLSIFLTLPQRSMTTHFRWLRMMAALIVTEMEKTRGRPATGHNILMCLDEFAGLRRMEIIENAVAQIAGYGVKMMFVLQSLEQLKAVYPERWETFLSNSSLKLFFSVEDHFTREYVSKFMGETEVMRDLQTRSKSAGMQESVTEGTSNTQSQSRTKSTTAGTSRGTSTSKGQSQNESKDSGAREGNIFRPGTLFAETISNALGGNTGRQWGSGSHSSEGTSVSRSESQSNSETSGFSNTYNQAKTSGRTETDTSGVNQSLQKRLLFTPDEIGKGFARRTDKSDPFYPGIALVLISGQNPLILQRSNYFEDHIFNAKYSTHPDHAIINPKEPLILPYLMKEEDIFHVRLLSDPSTDSNYAKVPDIFYETLKREIAKKEYEKLRIDDDGENQLDQGAIIYRHPDPRLAELNDIIISIWTNANPSEEEREKIEKEFNDSVQSSFDLAFMPMEFLSEQYTKSKLAYKKAENDLLTFSLVKFCFGELRRNFWEKIWVILLPSLISCDLRP